ncbi:hypothetical protein CFBP6411_03364 [Pseudomonas syringae group genomosp. 3]|uniref:Uncharacterized protein n=1 Tax=Pseudomonas syringae group genomosp. 3 TaxID=251701 RepID=A0A2K4WFR8_9PSED|nr:hypothetical protein [Pseudomonas syringae group genomosp. 3]SOS34721.1 hypothetical protein CFBP6411_03364 [Pseudomonas syringae group genomosp. 3]
MDNQAEIPDLADLERLAESATKGEWTCAKRADGRFWHIASGNQAIGSTLAASNKANPRYAAMFEANARFIAAASPIVVLALISEIQALREDADRYRWLRDKSESGHSFYLSVPLWLSGIRFRKEDVDAGIDAAKGSGEPS